MSHFVQSGLRPHQQDNITKFIQLEYSNSLHSKRVVIFDDIVRKVNVPKACKIFRMQSEKVAKIRTSRRMLFRDKIYFLNQTNLTNTFLGEST